MSDGSGLSGNKDTPYEPKTPSGLNMVNKHCKQRWPIMIRGRARRGWGGQGGETDRSQGPNGIFPSLRLAVIARVKG